MTLTENLGDLWERHQQLQVCMACWLDSFLFYLCLPTAARLVFLASGRIDVRTSECGNCQPQKSLKPARAEIVTTSDYMHVIKVNTSVSVYTCVHVMQTEEEK